MHQKTPLLIIGDAPSSATGLGRIARELASHIHAFIGASVDVATYGFGGTYTADLPFPQYQMSCVGNTYVPSNLPQVWQDFARGRKGYVLTVWNPSWLSWLTSPETLQRSALKDFLDSEPFAGIWGYFPVDAETHDGGLPLPIMKTIMGFDRVLAYTKYGAKRIERGHAIWFRETPANCIPCEYLPHGLNTAVFQPRPRDEARATFVERICNGPHAPLVEGVKMIGCVATNTPRKDWHLAFETCADMLAHGVNVGMWCHTDSFNKAWDLESLMRQFGLVGRIMFTNHKLTDKQMSWAYSACDVTLGIGSGEGWGYPLAESLACGVPVIHGDYAGGAEIVGEDTLVKPAAFRGDGPWGLKRPVFLASHWAVAAYRAMDPRTATSALLPTYIDWEVAWPKWEDWIMKGLES